MELDLDKEIDALLRRKDFAPDVTDMSDAGHLGADEISAFAENALPDAGRRVYMRHLAACDRCRTVLSNVIALNADGEERDEKSASPLVETAAAPWYRGLFSLPGLVYVMGALAVVFAGFLAFSIMRNDGGGSAEVSQVSDAPKSPASGPSAAETYPETIYSANSAANSNAASVATSTPESAAANAAANTAIVAANPASAKPTSGALSEAKTEASSFQPDGAVVPSAAPPPPASTADTVTAPPKDDKLAERERSDLSLSARRVDNLPAVRQAETQEDNQARVRAKRSAADAKSKVLSGPSRDMNTQIQNAANQMSQLPYNSRNTTGSPGPRSVAGRVFEFKQGVWYDKNFSGERTINIRRGTDVYRQLDAELRNAADELGGTVVIVWKSKAFRIQ